MARNDFEDMRQLAKREVKKGDRNYSSPKNIYSSNRLRGYTDVIANKYGDKAAMEFVKEFTSKRR